MSIHEDDGQLWAWDDKYLFGAHVWGSHARADLEAIRIGESRRIQLLANKLLRDFAEREKIFVFRPRDEADEAEMDAVHEALQTYGDLPLLWVTRRGERAPAALEQVRPNLFRGFVSPPTGKLADTTNLSDWVELCQSAWRLRQATRESLGHE